MTGTDRDDEFDEPLDLTDVQSKPRKKSFLARFVGAVTVLVSLLFLGIVAATAAVLWVLWTYGKDLPDYHQLSLIHI